jgi:predicted ATPase
MIKRIEIKNFKAIREAAVDLSPIHLLIGPNDSGKSSVLEAIAAICRSVDHDATNSFLGRWQGRDLVHSGSSEPNIELTVDIKQGQTECRYEIQAGFPSGNRQALWNSAIAHVEGKESNVRRSAENTLMSSAARSADSLAEAKKRAEWSVSETLSKCLSGCWYLRWNARNLALPVALNPSRRFRIEGNGFGLATMIDDILNYDRELFGKLEAEFTKLFPDVRAIALVQQQGFDAPVDQADETLTLRSSPGKQIVFRLKSSPIDLPASQAAEGMLYILGYLALMHLPQSPRVLLIEEPENGIHPLRVRDIVRILRELIERHPTTQIVITSHSPYLVDAFEPSEVTWCHRDESTRDVALTRLDTLPEVIRGLDVFSLGEIWTGELEAPSSLTAGER